MRKSPPFLPLRAAQALLALAVGATSLPLRGQDYGLTERPSVGPYLDGKLPETPPTISTNWSTVIAFPNLTFLNLLGLLPLPGTNRLVAWEREGRIYTFENNPGVSTKTLALDISAQCQGWDDCGLLGLAFHPDFANNRYVYIWYNWVTPGTTLGSPTARPPTATPTQQRLVRYTVDPVTGVFDTSSEYIVIAQASQFLWHNGGGMFFHPDNGFLYLTNGNGGSTANDQRITGGLFGGVLRIDVDKRGGTISHPPTKRPVDEVGPNWPNSYYIPSDNPFVGVAGANEEFFALGLRSPHRMTIDPLTRRIFIGDVGEAAREEIDTIEPSDPPGLNFQWNRIEGYNGDLTPPYTGINRRPILDYSHGADGFAVIGGYVYRGSEFPELYGKYLFADNVSNRIWMLDESTHTATTPASKILLATMPKGTGPSAGADYTGISSFGHDANGELYLCQLSSLGGYIYKLQRGGPPPSGALPATLSATGVFSDMAALTPSDKLVPYDLNQPFWSDRAAKTRWAAIPSETTVGFKTTGEWTWPAGSVFVKHFELPADDNDPSVHRRLETRLLVVTESGAVYGATYKWRPDYSDADLLDGSLVENVPVQITPLGPLTGADVGGPAIAGSTTRTGDTLDVQAGGNDIFGTSDQFHFAWQQRTGDFDVSVKIESLTDANLYTKAGLMARESLAAGSRNVFALVFPTNAARNNNDGGYEFQYRASTNGATTALYPAAPQPRVNFPNTWLRLRREGNTFTAYHSADGAWWTEYARHTIALPATIYFGAAVTSHDAGVAATARFQLQSARLQPWTYPSRVDCLTCHTAAAGGVLGPKTRQLNGDLLYPNGVTDNQLRAWSHVGLFDEPPAEDEIPSLDKLATPYDTTAPIELRARSFLDANCASCHRPGGVNALWDARFDTPLSQQGIVYGRLVNNLGDPLARVLFPQSPLHSMIHRRIDTVGPFQMPPIARNLVDQHSADIIKEWLNSLEPNDIPQTTLTAPANGARFLTPEMPVVLRATAFDADGIEKVSLYDGDTLIGEDFTEPYSIEWFSAWNGVHHLTAVASDRTGNVGVSSTVVVEVAPSFLPSPLGNSDVGPVGVAGSTTYNASTGTFVLRGSGVDIWDAADSFHFVHRRFTGDGDVIARIASLQNTDPWAKGGVMFRETLEAGSRFAFSSLTPSNGASYQLRTAPNTAAIEGARAAGIAAPRWVRIRRTGNIFRAYYSTDGVTWTQNGNLQIVEMEATVYAGLAVSAHNNAVLSEMVADNLQFVSPGTLAMDLSINFQPAGSAIPNAFTADTGAVFASHASGLSYGWETDRSASARAVAGGPDAAHNSFVPMGLGARWEISLPNGPYEVRIVAGDPSAPTGFQQITAEGQTVVNGATSAQTPFIDAIANVRVSDGRLTLAPGGSASNTKICFVQIRSYAVAANSAPRALVTSPVDGAVFANPPSIRIEAGASDAETAVARVEFFVNGVKIGENASAPYAIDWSAPTAGVHEVAARAIDAAGGMNISPIVRVTVKADNDPPVVALVAPVSGARILPDDEVRLTAQAGDTDGTIARVEFWANGLKLGETSTSPYTWTWTGPHARGLHTLQAVAYDNGGERVESFAVTVESSPVDLGLSWTPNGSGSPGSVSLGAEIPALRSYVIEWSADLETWMPLQSGVGNGNAILFTDEPEDGVNARFYRLRILD